MPKTPKPTQGFNADQLAGDRESAPITVGGLIYHPKRLTTKVIRDSRAIGREQSRHQRQAERLEREADAARDEGQDDRADELAQDADLAQDASMDCTFRMLAHHLNPAEGGEAPDPEALQEHLDVNDATALISFVMGRDEDPTQPTPTTTT